MKNEKLKLKLRMFNTGLSAAIATYYAILNTRRPSYMFLV